MPEIKPTKRAAAAIAAALAAASGVGAWLSTDRLPPAVDLAMTALVRPWEGRELRAYRDMVGVWTICDGDTDNVRPGMVETPSGCDKRLRTRLVRDYYEPLKQCHPGFTDRPVSWQAAMLSLAYNVGVSATCRSTALRLAAAGKLRESCEAATRFNRAGGRVVQGLVNRREMGDAARIGEAELCVSGL